MKQLTTFCLLATLLFFAHCKKKEDPNPQPSGPKTKGRLNFTFTIDGKPVETTGDPEVTVSTIGLYAAKGVSRFNDEDTVVFAMRSVTIDSVIDKLPLIINGTFPFSEPNADFLFKTHEGDKHILYTMESDMAGVSMAITSIDTAHKEFIVSFGGQAYKAETDANYQHPNIIEQVPVSNGSFILSYKKKL